MKNCLKITNITKKQNTIEIKYEATDVWNQLLNMNEYFFSEYDVNIENVPDSIAITPFLSNIIPMCWVFDATIVVDELDQEFYNCLEDVKKGYKDMYPNIPMKGNLIVNNLIKNEYKGTKTAVFFSGGVDAFNTLINHIETSPDLLTVWGSDIKLKDKKGWNIVKKQIESVAQQFNLNFSSIKTNFRTFLNYQTLYKGISMKVNGEWWHEFQHGIGLIGLAFPLAYIKKYNTLYIASSFTESMKGNYTCASDPTIDNYFKFSNCKVVHDGYEYTRQDKINNICNYSKKGFPINLRVCWEAAGGENCCKCEKCFRTIIGIKAEKQDPIQYGFKSDYIGEYNKKLYNQVKYNNAFAYQDIQKRFKENYTEEETTDQLKWFRDIKIKYTKPKYIWLCERICSKLKRICRKIFK